MDLMPSERAVLGQIRDLFLEASVRTYRLSALSGRWPVIHFDAYRFGFSGLVSKGLITQSLDRTQFSITNAGLKAMT
jgi:hypothetical protein